MPTVSPEVRPWPESHTPPGQWELERGLSVFPEERRWHVLGVIGRLQSMMNVSDTDEALFGTRPSKIKHTVIPQVEGSAIGLEGSLAPFMEKGKSPQRALVNAGNAVAEEAVHLNADQFCVFRMVMAEARRFAGLKAIERSGMEWDLARAAGWALLREGQNPYMYLVEFESFHPERLIFKLTQEGKGKPEWRLVTDFRIDTETRKVGGDLVVACIAHPLQKRGKEGTFYVHDIEADCSTGQPFEQPPRRRFL